MPCGKYEAVLAPAATSVAQLRRAVAAAEIVEMDASNDVRLHRPGETLARIRRFLARHVPAR